MATEQDKWQELRKPFPKEVVGQLPKPTISNDEWKKLPKAKCSVCNGYHATQSTIHLDYVGHAAVTDRLLTVDPEWSWEPVATDERGLPAYDDRGGLWIRLMVCGVTRLGYGDGPDPKQRIGDALRNAAMRFGVALDLWTKDELESNLDHPELKNEKPGRVSNAIKAATRERARELLAEHTRTGENATDIIRAILDKDVPTTESDMQKLIEALEVK